MLKTFSFINRFFVYLIIVDTTFLVAADSSITKAVHDEQHASLEFIDHQKIKMSLSSSPIKNVITIIKSKHNQIKAYVVELADGTQAVFKERKLTNIFNEVLSYEIAHQIFKLKLTVPPTVTKDFNGRLGILQYYINPLFDLSNDLPRAIQHADRTSYADLQTFLFCTGMGDLNVGGIIPWQNSKGAINFSYVDSELICSMDFAYGKSSPEGRSNIDEYRNPQHVFTSSYTSFFNHETLSHLKSVSETDLKKVLDSTIANIENNGIKLIDKEILKRDYISLILKKIIELISHQK